MVKESGYKGLQKDIRDISLPGIEVWENRYPDKDYTVSLKTEEFTCVCPKTGLPDFADLFIDYKPDEHCVELKSFKEYILAYRDIGVFHEHVVNRVMEDMIKSCKPRWIKVRGVFNVRGGITTTVEVEFPSKKGQEYSEN